MKYVIFSSCGNDSVALCQWVFENKDIRNEDICVAYSETGWAADWWPKRVAKVREWVESKGAEFCVIASEGMINMVERMNIWPCNGRSFCSYELKIKPAQEWLDEHDKEKQAICMVGVMRLESEKRKNWPEYLDASPNHGDRPLWSPMAAMSTEQRDGLLSRAGFDVLPHRSMECFPCVNSNRGDLRMLANDPKRIQMIEDIEDGLGYTKNNKKRTMFRPNNFQGATGIREVVRWAMYSPGQYRPDQEDLFGCDSGFCE